jgi:metallophosphoesterase (TIGR00282 family)
MKVLFIGDIMGKIGRRALVQLLPGLQDELQPGITIANAENLAHGAGVTASTLGDLSGLKIDCYTGGNHSLAKPEGAALFDAEGSTLLRPDNLPEGSPGRGRITLTVSQKPVLVLSLLGSLFVKEPADNPFRAFDALWQSLPEGPERPLVFVDFHAEATSEKLAFARYADGRAAAIVGTHTHVPTADARILPGGTAYVTDVGMTGYADGVIGIAAPQAIRGFLGEPGAGAELPDKGSAVVNAVLITLDPKSGHATEIERIDRTTTIS